MPDGVLPRQIDITIAYFTISKKTVIKTIKYKPVCHEYLSQTKQNALTLVRKIEPSKRKIKPPSQPLLDLEFGESSDDSDFNIDDIHQGSDDDDDSSVTDDENGTDKSSLSDDDDDDDDEEDEEEEEECEKKDVISNDLNLINKSEVKTEKSLRDLLEKVEPHQVENKLLKAAEGVMICCACLGDKSDHINEIVECDSCGVTVHEGCYGISDSLSVSSSESLCPTEPWFCEACRAGVVNPSCELCPNKGGIFKATDVGRWVHLVCALYVPGVAFGEVEGLTNVTLFEMPYSKWGAKSCVLCEDHRLASTGINIGCDAGMCRTYFHVTCAQREGLLSEAHSEEVDQADPFYAHCKLHTDKTLMKRRKRNYIVMQYKTKKKTCDNSDGEKSNATAEALRVQRKLAKKRAKYLALKKNSPTPWVPTQKMPRLLTTSASVCRELWRKAELMGIDSDALEAKESRVAVLTDINKKWHVPPAFSYEFTGYFLDRNNRIPAMKKNLENLLLENGKLSGEQEDLKKKYDQALMNKQEVENFNVKLKKILEKFHSFVQFVAPNKRLPVVSENLVNQPRTSHPLSTMSVPTAAALKAGVGYPIARTNYKGQLQTEPKVINKQEQVPPLTSFECGICRSNLNQHLLAKCDTCHFHYHLGCLTPPLSRMPKKTKLMGWQCSECDQESGNSNMEDIEGPRKLRRSKEDSKNVADASSDFIEGKWSVSKIKREKKRKKEEHPGRYSPEFLGTRKHKKKKKNLKIDNLPRIKIKIKAIPNPMGEGVSSENTQMFVASSSDIESDPLIKDQESNFTPFKSQIPNVVTQCDTCGNFDDNKNLVMCDECQKSFHFGCLDPPLKKSPKMRGYSWHCADCDPTDSDHK
ncbi:PHD finger protein, putative [Pediculus humanus corporis]|uniref:PHD finger protein, putative n=1 Tax=Pediculus humanus subsp. corporis TaxID=121224 RepID=E0VLJ4_PEDHC|nr:PHD finger protein, putative [Pediculus humanus corporis]EEB14250.1 PHD finger protein, putative [Pediculus humanus corporis]